MDRPNKHFKSSANETQLKLMLANQNEGNLLREQVRSVHMKSYVCAFILNDSFLSFSQFVIYTTDLESDFESQNFGSNGAHNFRLVSHYATRMSIALRASLLEITRIRGVIL